MEVKFDVVIDDKELGAIVHAAIHDQIKKKALEYINGWTREGETNALVKLYYDATLEGIVVAAVQNSEVIKARVEKALEAKLRAQLTRLTKA